jgi:thioredoxin reductase
VSEAERPFPPGDYPALVVGSGPGGIQLSYDLRRLGVDNALLSRDEGPGGMFRRFPMYQRLITASRPHCVVERGSAQYFRFDWNSMVTDEPGHQALVTEFMDGTSYFPARDEMVRGLATFTERAGVEARYGCEWQSTRQADDGRYVLTTSDGEYTAPVVAFAVGMVSPWTPPTPGIDDVPHYVDLEHRPLESFAGKSVFVVGKRNSGFEIADALLPWARRLIVGSPHPVRPSITTGFPTPPRARYVLPLEDHMFRGGTFVIDVTLDSIERAGEGWRVRAQGTTVPGEFVIDVDEVIACTGFGVEMRDLKKLGVDTFFKDRLPTQTAYWESTTMPGIYFAGAATQGQAGMRKYGWPSHSASVGGFRFNAKVQARHIAEKHFGIRSEAPQIDPDGAVDYLLEQATSESALWSQQSNLARALSYDNGTVRDDGIVPLMEFVDADPSAGLPDAVAIAVETDREENTQPAVYIRRGGDVTEHVFEPNWLHDYRTDANRARLGELLARLGG